MSYVARQFVDGGRALAQVVTQRGKAHFQRCICLGGFIQHHFQMHARVDFRMVLRRLRHAVQTVNFRQQHFQRAAVAQHLQHARRPRCQQTFGQFLPDAFADQGIHFPGGHHVLHQCQCLFGHCECGEPRRKTRHPQNAHRVFAKRIRHMPQHLVLQVLLPAIRVDQPAVVGLRDSVDAQVAPRQIFFQRHFRRGVYHKTFVARRGFALGACQCVFLVGARVQKHRKVFTYRREAKRRHVLWRAAHHHPVAVRPAEAQQGIAHCAADQIGFQGLCRIRVKHCVHRHLHGIGELVGFARQRNHPQQIRMLGAAHALGFGRCRVRMHAISASVGD